MGRVDSAHAKSRAYSRYGMTLTGKEIKKMVERIKGSDKELARRLITHPERPSREVWMLNWRDVWMLAVYDTEVDGIITFLDPSTQFTESGYMVKTTLEKTEAMERKKWALRPIVLNDGKKKK